MVYYKGSISLSEIDSMPIDRILEFEEQAKKINDENKKASK